MTSPEEYAELDALEAQSAAESTAGRSPASWAPIDLGPIITGIETGQDVGPVPTLLTRTDGVALLYPGEIHSLAAPPESMKNWIVAKCVADLLNSGRRVLHVDFEDGPRTAVTRQLALGVTGPTIAAGLAYLQPETAPHPGALDNLLATGPYELAVLDGMTEAYALLGFNSYENQDAADFLRQMVKPVAATGAAVVLIDHVTKSKEASVRFPLGAGHKLAAVAAAFTVDVIEPPSRQRPGTAKLLVVKDRHGHIRGQATKSKDGAAVIAMVTLTPSNDGDQVAIELTPPDSDSKGTGAAGEYFRPTTLMERVSKFVEDNPNASIRTIRSSVHGKASGVDAAINALVAEGWISCESKGQAHLHKSATPYRAAADTGDRVPVSQPRPTVSQDTGETDRVPVSPPYKGDTERDTPTRTPRLAIHDDHEDTL